MAFTSDTSMAMPSRDLPRVGEAPSVPHAPSKPGPGARSTARKSADLADRLAALGGMDRAELAAEWRRHYRSKPPERVARDVLELAIAWKLQERVHGGLKRTTHRRLNDMAETIAAKGDLVAPKVAVLKPGTRLVREWGGTVHEVVMLADGFSCNGRNWVSLSAIAAEITGAHWSGPRFFGLTSRAKRQAAPGHVEADLDSTPTSGAAAHA